MDFEKLKQIDPYNQLMLIKGWADICLIHHGDDPENVIFRIKKMLGVGD